MVVNRKSELAFEHGEWIEIDSTTHDGRLIKLIVLIKC